MYTSQVSRGKKYFGLVCTQRADIRAAATRFYSLTIQSGHQILVIHVQYILETSPGCDRLHGSFGPQAGMLVHRLAFANKHNLPPGGIVHIPVINLQLEEVMQDICMDKPNSTFYRLALRLTLSYPTQLHVGRQNCLHVQYVFSICAQSQCTIIQC